MNREHPSWISVASFVIKMRSVAWLFGRTEPALPPEAHSTEKSRIGKAIHAATRMRPHDSDISFPIEQTSALCSRVKRQQLTF